MTENGGLIELPAAMENLPRFLSFSAEAATRQGFPPARRNQIGLALEEALVNIISYAYAGDRGRISLEARPRDDGSLAFLIRDRGRPFNPLAKADPDLDSELAERPVGGLGIYLIRQFSDETDWQRCENENRLTLVFTKP